MRITDHETAKSYGPEDPDYDRVRISNLQNTVRDLQTAVVDLQHRLARQDGEEPPWPGDTYEPTHTHPYQGPTDER